MYLKANHITQFTNACMHARMFAEVTSLSRLFHTSSKLTWHGLVIVGDRNPSWAALAPTGYCPRHLVGYVIIQLQSGVGPARHFRGSIIVVQRGC